MSSPRPPRGRERGRAQQPRILLLAAGLVLLAALPAGAAELAVELSPPSITVGDRVEVVLTLATGPGDAAALADPARAPRFPIWGDTWGPAEILEIGPVERLAQGFRQRLVVTGFRPGAVALPPRFVDLPGGGETVQLTTPADLGFTVASVLPPEEAGAGALAPRPPAAPRQLPLGSAFWWTLAAGTALAAGALALAWLASRPADRAAAAPHLSPLAELEAALGAAAREPGPEAAHVLLSLALRRYLGRAFGFPAAESTTSEIRRELRSRRAPDAVATGVDHVLRSCDQVKFARRASLAATLAARIDLAREVGRETERHLAPPAALEEAA